MNAKMFMLQKSVTAGKNSATAAQKFAAPGLSEAELRLRPFAMWR
jgi:predicted secreted hydrolase